MVSLICMNKEQSCDSSGIWIHIVQYSLCVLCRIIATSRAHIVLLPEGRVSIESIQAIEDLSHFYHDRPVAACYELMKGSQWYKFDNPML